MSILRLHENIIAGPEIEVQCADFDFETAHAHRSNDGLWLQAWHKPDLQKPYWSLCITCNFYARDSETQTKYQLLNFDGATPLCTPISTSDLEWIENTPHLKDSYFTEIFHGYEGDITADDAPAAVKVRYAQLTGELASGSGRTIYTKNGAQWVPTEYGHTAPSSNIPAYYKCSKDFSKYYISNDGLYNVTFGARSQTTGVQTCFGSFDSLESMYASANGFGLALTDQGTVYSSGTSFKRQWYTATTTQQWMTQLPVNLGGVFPVHIVVKAGSYEMQSGYGKRTLAFEKDTILFGTAAYSLSEDGDYGTLFIQTAEDILWKSYQSRKADMGDDTKPTGGNGPFKIGTDTPLKKITKATKNGISTNPTVGSGFFIYRFTDTEWSNFLEWMGNSIGENIEYIKFVYKSPLEFPTKTYSLKGIKVGSVEIVNSKDPTAVTHYPVKVVQSTIKEVTSSTSSAWPAQTFSDLEPYSSTAIQMPFCSALQIPPSLIYSSDEDNVITNVTVQMYYDLLSRAASGTVIISRNGQGITHFSTFGECACEVPTVLKRDVVGDIGKQLAPTVAAGVATIATGGTTAPLLVGTAAGAATGFTQMSTNMAQVNLPNISSSGPYWDTVNSGQYTCSVLGLRSPRFTSGESATYGDRGMMIGYTSGYFINKLGMVSNEKSRAYVEVEAINLRLGSGTAEPMSKVQSDKIVALLKEGVII